MMQRWKHLTRAVCACLLTLVCMAAAAEGGVVQGGTISGVVRVYLSSISSLKSVDMTIDGSYSIDGDMARAIARGTKVKIANTGGALTLTMNGQTISMGSRFKLRRHETSGNNGVTIAQARYPGSLYPGDIELIAKGSNVQIIVHVYMEDYMRGVLPYEMDNSFPLEALKAQAVAARTYALRKMSSHSATYDVVDTTSDQVYNGTPSGNARCRQAVEETSCIVGMVNGDFMASYYTASNGGQTESVKNAWGSGSYAYLTVKDDPFDLRNSASIAKSVTISRKGTTNVAALTNLIKKEAAAKLGVSGINIEAITSVSLRAPKYAEPSRVYTKVDIGVRAAGYGETTVSLDYFSQVEGICSLSINALKNETLAVEETDGGWKLVARRFGHGVGMSQRGAQQMGNEGYTYDQILDFYFPGIVRTRYTMTRSIAATMDGTVSDEETLPPVTRAEQAVVMLENPLSHANLRKAADGNSAILASIPHGTQVTLLDRAGEWSYVQYGLTSGYVGTQYIVAQEMITVQTDGLREPKGTAMVNLSDESQTLNIRLSPTTSSNVISRVRHGQTLTVLERYDAWTCVSANGVTGFVANDYILFESDEDENDETDLKSEEGTAATEEKEETASARTAIVLPSGGLRLRASESANAGILMVLPQGTRLTVRGEAKDGKLPVSIGEISGFVAEQYVYLVDDTIQEADEQTEGSETGDAEPEPILTAFATVEATGGLKLRSAASSGAKTIITIPNGATVTIQGEAENGFYPVEYGSYLGFASEKYLRRGDSMTPIPIPTATPDAAEPDSDFEETDPEEAQPEETIHPIVTAAPAATPVPEASRIVSGWTASVSATDGLNLRAEPNAGSTVLTTLGYGTEVVVTGESQNGFYPVRAGEMNGYVSAGFVTADIIRVTQAPVVSIGATPEPEKTESDRRVLVASENGLNLRAQPDAQSEVLYVLPYGMVLYVRGEAENGFLFVEWAGYTGYVSASFVQELK